jgi:glutathione synthase/RimK-type ligase-like ATP-grasp enzyme
MRVAFATAAPGIIDDWDVDRPLHEAAFARAAITLDHRTWRDPSVRWEEYDLVVIRSTWDYVEHLDEFLSWLDRLAPLGTVHNPPPLVSWNLDKAYLQELDALGVDIIPTALAATPDALAAALGSSTGEVVVKPTVSAGSRNTARYPDDHPGARDLGERILAAGHTVMVQPAVRSVGETGELSTVLFDGEVSHSFRKAPILGPAGTRQGQSIDRVEPAVLQPPEMALVTTAAEAVTAIMRRRGWADTAPLYARIDLVTMDDGAPAILEVELAEPSFYLGIDPRSADRFVAAVSARFGRDATSAAP